MKERNDNIDLFKYLASVCIIAIHTEPFRDIHAGLNYFTAEIVARLAVPFFAVCTGYFTAEKLVKEEGWNQKKTDAFIRQWKKIILLYSVWTLLYLVYSVPMWIRTDWFSAWAFVDYFIAAVRSESHYHLWYLLALIYAFPLYYLCIRYLKRSLWLPVSVILYAIYTVYYCYSYFLPEPIAKIVSLLNLFTGFSNGCFLLLPLLLLGAFLAGKEPASKRRNWLGFACFFMLLCAEATIISSLGQKKVSYLVFSYPVAAFLFRLICQSRCPIEKGLCRKLGSASMIVYCFHPMLVETMERMGLSHILRFIAAFVLATAVALTWDCISEKWKGRKQCFN